jgi:hypothetical protein
MKSNTTLPAVMTVQQLMTDQLGDEKEMNSQEETEPAISQLQSE